MPSYWLAHSQQSDACWLHTVPPSSLSTAQHSRNENDTKHTEQTENRADARTFHSCMPARVESYCPPHTSRALPCSPLLTLGLTGAQLWHLPPPPLQRKQSRRRRKGRKALVVSPRPLLPPSSERRGPISTGLSDSSVPRYPPLSRRGVAWCRAVHIDAEYCPSSHVNQQPQGSSNHSPDLDNAIRSAHGPNRPHRGSPLRSLSALHTRYSHSLSLSLSRARSLALALALYPSPRPYQVGGVPKPAALTACDAIAAKFAVWHWKADAGSMASTVRIARILWRC